MKLDVQTRLNDLQKRIELNDMPIDLKGRGNWEGADVRIANKSTTDLRAWTANQPFVISFQSSEPRRRAVLTKYDKELSWLFYELRDIFSGHYDHVSKYDFFGLLAQSALNYLEFHKEKQTATDLLLAVLHGSKEFLKGMSLPHDTDLPFFAYGIFKPGQLCYSRIRDNVEMYLPTMVSGTLKERDGIPLLVLEGKHPNIKGFLIHFKPGEGNDAYEKIIGIEPDHVYRWGTVQIDDLISNVLLGKSADRGSSVIEHLDEWDGRNDPFFKQGLEEVESILLANQEFDWDLRALLRLQMAYALLWTAIERYAGLKYHLGKDATRKVYNIAYEICFANALMKYVKEPRILYSSTDLCPYKLDPNDPVKSIKYYYQVRCNSVHRGKAVVKDFYTMKSSLEELLAIFKDMLDGSFSV